MSVTNESTSEAVSASAKESTSGARLRRARVLAGITTRRAFQEKYNVSANTLQGWEQGKNPLSFKGARRIVEALKNEGLICSVEWLMNGNGMPPRPYEMLSAGIDSTVNENSDLYQQNLHEEQSIYQEIQTFKDQNPNAIVISITDNAMEPYFFEGDYIGGIQIPNYETNKYVNRFCILELENNHILARQLQPGKTPATFTVSCTNPLANTTPLNLYNVRVINAAPIVWVRRKIAALSK